AGRITSPYCYWLITSPAHRARADVAQFCDWVEAQAALTRAATGEDEAAATPPRPAR
ncbi:MAG: hypothetical protein JSR38_13110, partial [Proteobacteria bacterium]|nr:hypothetical protein [Pseudomonadota bacterium]